jgi:hypothetical protein
MLLYPKELLISAPKYTITENPKGNMVEKKKTRVQIKV